MGSFANFWENEIMDHVFGSGNRDYTPPSSLYLALSPTDFGEAGAGGTEPESAGNGYARVPTCCSDWAASSDGFIQNCTDLSFTQATSDWDIQSFFGIFDALTGGNCVAFGTLTASKDIQNGDTAKFSAPDITISLD